MPPLDRGISLQRYFVKPAIWRIGASLLLEDDIAQGRAMKIPGQPARIGGSAPIDLEPMPLSLERVRRKRDLPPRVVAIESSPVHVDACGIELSQASEQGRPGFHPGTERGTPQHVIAVKHLTRHAYEGGARPDLHERADSPLIEVAHGRSRTERFHEFDRASSWGSRSPGARPSASKRNRCAERGPEPSG